MLICSSKSKNKLCHKPCCQYVNKISQNNKMILSNYEAAKKIGYRMCNCCFSDTYLIKKTRLEVKLFCKEHNLACYFEDNRVFIKNRFSKWYFDITEGKLKLMHENNNRANSTKNDYHCQFKKYISVKDVIQYIVDHDEYKYEQGPRIFYLLNNIRHINKSMYTC